MVTKGQFRDEVQRSVGSDLAENSEPLLQKSQWGPYSLLEARLFGID